MSGGVLNSLRRHAHESPDAPAVASAGATWTYAELNRLVLACSARVQRGTSAGDSVLLRCRSCPEFVAWFLGCLHAGVRVCPIHATTPDAEAHAIARATGAQILIGKAGVQGLQHLPLDLSGDCPHTLPRRGLGSVVLQSSGSTGRAKLPRRDEASLDADAIQFTAGTDLQSSDRVLAAIPLSHSYGVDVLVGVIAAGATLHIVEGFDRDTLAHALQHAGVTVFPGVPFMYEGLLGSKSNTAPSKLRLALSAGSRLPSSVRASWEQEWGLRVTQLYGASELGTVVVGRGDDTEPHCVGHPLPGVRVRALRSGDGMPAGTREIGELAVRAPSMLTEYVGEPLELADGHFKTGDLGFVDESGRVHVTGRLKHLIDVGGLKVNPLEVEDVFSGHPAVRECAVVGVPLSETVVRLRLLYVPANGTLPAVEEFRAFARERLSPHKLPRVFEAVASLPRSATGKLLRERLELP